MLMAFLNRAYVKTVLVKQYGWDDFTLLLSFLGVLAYFSVTIWGAVELFFQARSAS
jgi:hypothetical protein